MTRTTPIRITIEGDPAEFVARTPCVPHLWASADEEHAAVNRLVEQIRARTADYMSERGEPVPWVADGWPERTADERQINLTGLWPSRIAAVHRASKTVTLEESDHGEN